MATSHPRPCMVLADAQGQIYDDPELLMLCRKGNEWTLPRPDEVMPLPPESELFLLPGRHAVGLNPETGETVEVEELAVAAFIAPAHTLTGHPVYVTDETAPTLPLFAYAAVGMIGDRFYVCAKKVDEDPRQIFTGIPQKKINHAAKALMARFPKNRLIQHLMQNCVLRYGCPAAKNLALGRYEAPMPTSRVCNARCVGCISHKNEDSTICATPQDRLTFTPTSDELVEMMLYHMGNEPHPIYSFGQGCEGEPLTEAPLLIETVRKFRERGGTGTINLNSNASMPDAVAALAEAGLTSLRVSMNSARDEVYLRYYRPKGFSFTEVRRSIAEAHARGVYVSLNLLYFPGITDCEEEIEALVELINTCGVQFIQLRNLNIDPELYLKLMEGIDFGPSVGLSNFRKRLKKYCPGLRFGYFNPFVDEDKKEETKDELAETQQKTEKAED
ncbi:radical SAM protein [uncultured Mailhella sp.]|uniref:radical SAM protein n=1 Tax=uncultured Mailhella sp. TaxID=1981031 RepID=UPI0026275953|nr:radical SAM protein [uncultured Mailhella sp.]